MLGDKKLESEMGRGETGFQSQLLSGVKGHMVIYQHKVHYMCSQMNMRKQPNYPRWMLTRRSPWIYFSDNSQK